MAYISVKQTPLRNGIHGNEDVIFISLHENEAMCDKKLIGELWIK